MTFLHRSMIRVPLLVAALVLAGAAGCRTPAPPPPIPGPLPTNRDPHGPRDVDRYIRMLESESRVRMLQPDVVVSRLAPARDAVVADVGSGPGVFSLPFARACPEGVVYAVDLEPRQLDALRERIHTQGVRNVVPVLASSDDPHLPPGRVDLIFIANTYHHLADRIAYMSLLRAYLAPGGRLAILEYRPGELPVGPPPEHKLAEGVRQRELEAAGWKQLESFETHPYHEFDVWAPAE